MGSQQAQHPLTLYFLRYQLNLHNDPQEKEKKKEREKEKEEKPVVLRMGNTEIQDASVMSGEGGAERGFPTTVLQVNKCT